MASFVIGFFLGAYAGAIAREEYYFPTSERIQHAVSIFKKNEEEIRKAREASNAALVPATPVTKEEKK